MSDATDDPDEDDQPDPPEPPQDVGGSTPLTTRGTFGTPSVRADSLVPDDAEGDEPEQVDGTARSATIETAATVHPPSVSVSAPAQPAAATMRATNAGVGVEDQADGSEPDVRQGSARMVAGAFVRSEGTAVRPDSGDTPDLTVEAPLSRAIGPVFADDDPDLFRSITEERIDRTISSDEAAAVRYVLEVMHSMVRELDGKIPAEDFQTINSVIQSAIAQTYSPRPNADDLGRGLGRLGTLLGRLGKKLKKAARSGLSGLPAVAFGWASRTALDEHGDLLIERAQELLEWASKILGT